LDSSDSKLLPEVKIEAELCKYTPLTYDEFKLTRASMLETLEINVAFLKPYLTPFACEKAKYNAVQGIKYWRVVKQDKANKIYEL
jgi:hypothetical protein